MKLSLITFSNRGACGCLLSSGRTSKATAGPCILAWATLAAAVPQSGHARVHPPIDPLEFVGLKRSYRLHGTVQIRIRNHSNTDESVVIELFTKVSDGMDSCMADIFAKSEPKSSHLFTIPAHKETVLTWRPDGQPGYFKPKVGRTYLFYCDAAPFNGSEDNAWSRQFRLK